MEGPLSVGGLSKKSILRAPLCLDRYFVFANALQLDSTCAIDSCAFPHILHLTSDSSLDLTVFQSDIHSKLSPSRSLSSQHAVWSFAFHLCSLTPSQCLFCNAFLVHTPILWPSIFSFCCSARWIWISQL